MDRAHPSTHYLNLSFTSKINFITPRAWDSSFQSSIFKHFMAEFPLLYNSNPSYTRRPLLKQQFTVEIPPNTHI